jgi:hypothetical protein
MGLNQTFLLAVHSDGKQFGGHLEAEQESLPPFPPEQSRQD